MTAGLRELAEKATRGMREDVARAIDPVAAEMQGRETASVAFNRANEDAWAHALTKADAILDAVSLAYLPALSALLDERDRMREALEPFARIAPSSFYDEDGSEAERYTVRLYDNTRHEPPHDFTGADLARARAALGNTPAQEKTDE